EERAATVRDLLVQGGVGADRVSAEGRADSEPVVDNASASNRALNRRVEVTLRVGSAPAAAKTGS
ncbi:MAG: type VI secretion system protein TssL, partial [Rhizobacter sp.]|nr:type VI secretion system protein TssL [Rhizobacter sp.]